MFEVTWSILALVVTLGILVTFHEFGHFWVARRNGVKVLTFSVGFGRAIWSRTAADGTVYQVSMIPLGGYVKMLDDRVDEVSSEQRQYSFNSKTIGQRAAIIAAGPIANFLLAMVLLWGMYVIGVPSVKPIIGGVTEQSIAAQANLPAGAEIVAIDGTRTMDWQEVNLAFASALGQDAAVVSVKNSQGITKDYSLNTAQWRLSTEQQPTFRQIGIEPFRPQPTLELAQVSADSPAAAAGLRAGDKIIAIDGTLMTDWSQTQSTIQGLAGQQVEFEVLRAGQTEFKQVQLGSREQGQQQIGYLGVLPAGLEYPQEYRFVHQYGFFEGLWRGAEHTWRLMGLTVDMLGKFVTGTVSLSHIGGPATIAEGAGVSASFGLVYFLGFLALISVNLGIINLLPLPVLDGGHLLFLAIEKVQGRPVSDRVQDISYRVGGALIFALMVIAISNDVLRLAS